MDNTGQITEETKNELYKKIVDIMLVSLENGVLTADESEDASFFILEQLDTIPDEYHLDAFIEELVKRWPCFTPLLQPKKEEESRIADQQNIENITNQLKNLT